jgi:hypothetical protein
MPRKNAKKKGMNMSAAAMRMELVVVPFVVSLSNHELFTSAV